MAIIVKDYHLIKDWNFSTGGKTAIGEKDEKKYFLKKYVNISKPIKTSAMSTANYEKKLVNFQKTINFRNSINKKLLEAWVEKGNIVCPVDSFLDDDNHFVEATEFYDDIIEDVSGLTLNQKDLILKTITGALMSIHEKNIVHGDLKMTNVMICKNSMGNYVGKIIDFDCSYFEDKVPTGDIGGDQIFLSPELGAYIISELNPEYRKLISTKSDIFSLGLIFHLVLSNKYPSQSCEKELLDSHITYYPFEILLKDGGKLEIDNSIIDSYKEIIAMMLELSPYRRPSANQVLDMLKHPEEIAYYKEELSHQKATLFEEEKTNEVEEVPVVDHHTAEPSVEVSKSVNTDDTKNESDNDLFNPYLEENKVGEMWPEDQDKYVIDMEALSNRGYNKVERLLKGDEHCYALTKNNGDVKILRIDTMVLLHYVVKK